MKRSVTFVELDLDRCVNVYGESPCTAAVGTTGDRKCYNTRATCQDPDNYAPEPATVRFAVASDYLYDTGITAIPSVVNVRHSPARIRIAEDLGERASVRVSFQDHPDSDLTQDPYISERPDPPGTFWGRFRARHKFILGRPLRWIEGYVGQTLGQMVTRHYIIESIAGPDLSGRVTITAKDPLKLADGDRARVPALSTGELAASISDTDTTATLTPTGIGNAEYPASGKVAIGQEIMSFTRSDDTLTLTRAQSGTEADDHDNGDRVQLVRIYTAQTAATILNDLLVNGASVPSSLIDISDWNARDKGRQYSAEIAEPESVRKLVGELMEQSSVTLWFDEIANTIRYRSLEDLSAPADDIDEDIILADSYRQQDQPSKRVSQAWVYYGKVNPLEREDDNQNYKLSVLQVDLDSQSADQYGQPGIKQIFSRWIPAGAGAVAAELASITLSRFVNPPRKFRFSMQADTRPALTMGSTLRLSVPSLQNDAGNIVSATVNVLAREDSWDAHDLDCEEQLFTSFDPGTPGGLPQIPIEEDANNVNLRDVFDNSGLGIEPDDDTDVIFVVRDGIVVGSDSASEAALTVGDWPSGATITLRVRPGAYISGKGGNGGSGQTVLPAIDGGTVAQDGDPGGVGLLANRAIEVENDGTIQGGAGGGGGGGGSATQTSPIRYAPGGGGGGGAGRTLGSAGASGGNAGLPGTLDDGGNGGEGVNIGGNISGDGGDGGDPGQAGGNGQDGSPGVGGVFTSGGAGGAAGAAIDGDSNVTLTGSGTVLGAQIN